MIKYIRFNNELVISGKEDMYHFIINNMNDFETILELIDSNYGGCVIKCTNFSFNFNLTVKNLHSTTARKLIKDGEYVKLSKYVIRINVV